MMRGTISWKIKKWWYKREYEEFLKKASEVKYSRSEIALKKEKEKTIIKKIARNDRKSKFSIMDMETIVLDGRHYPFALGVYDGSKYRIYYSENESEIKSNKVVLDYIEEYKFKKQNHYAHNMSGFDGVFIIRECIDKDIDVEVVAKNTTFYAIKIEKLTIKDSYKLLPRSLDDLGKEMLGVSKLYMDYNFNLNRIVEEKDKIIEYLNRDLEITYKVIEMMQEEMYDTYKVDCCKTLTLPSLAMKIFRKHYYKKEVLFKPRKNKYEFLNKCFKGGIMELYKPRGDNVHVYNINSSYPNVMKSCKLPIGFGKFVSKYKLGELDVSKFFGFIRAWVEVNDKNYINLLSVKLDGRNIYPNGIFEGYFFSEELKVAIENGAKIIKILEALEYDKEVVFGEFIDDIYAKRKMAIAEGKHGRGMVLKLIMNSLYGRFGLRKVNYKTRILSHNEYLKMSKKPHIVHFRIKDKLLVSSDMGENKYSIYSTAVSASITAYARIKLFNKMVEIKKIGWEVYYCDTDSIFTNCPPDKFPGGIDKEKNLGDWSMEVENAELKVVAPKFYVLKDKEGRYLKTASKGIPGKTDIESKMEAKEKGISYVYKKSIIRNIKNMEIHSMEKSIVFRNRSEKRIRIIINGNWVDTQPILLHYEAIK